MQYDLTRPNSGRIIDYWLGGHHNFEIDRQLADRVAQQFPILPQIVRAGRQKVKRAVKWCYARGIRAFVDFGSGLPTCENTHQVAHALDLSVKVVYSDIDPITVAYGQELLQDIPNVIYLQADAANPCLVLDSPQTRALLGDERRVGIMFLALAHLIPEEPLRAAWRILYDWVAPGSYMIISTSSERWSTDPDLVALDKMYARSGRVFFHRGKEQILELLPPWQLVGAEFPFHVTWDINLPAEATRPLGYSMMVHKPK